ncbi:sulfotransferase [Halioglobus pacificus]|uniref:sulfotransferase n=1 Tax=Parahalioglobus pacificus TaxID=930806 RepID=UPI0016735EE0
MEQTELIFLISQPRSGSTLTQRLIATHEEVFTRSEPWLMLRAAQNIIIYGAFRAGR